MDHMYINVGKQKQNTIVSFHASVTQQHLQLRVNI